MITFLVQPEALVAADTPIWDVIDRCRKHRNRRCLSKQMIEFVQLFQCIMSNKSHTAVISFRFNDISSKFGVKSASDLLHGEGVVCSLELKFNCSYVFTFIATQVNHLLF